MTSTCVLTLLFKLIYYPKIQPISPINEQTNTLEVDINGVVQQRYNKGAQAAKTVKNTGNCLPVFTWKQCRREILKRIEWTN